MPPEQLQSCCCRLHALSDPGIISQGSQNFGQETFYYPQVKKSGSYSLSEVTVPRLGSQSLSFDHFPSRGPRSGEVFLVILFLQGSAQPYFTLPLRPFHTCLKYYYGQPQIILGQMGQLWIIMIISKKKITLQVMPLQKMKIINIYTDQQRQLHAIQKTSVVCPHSGTIDIMPYGPESLPTGRVVLWRAELPFQQCPLRVKHHPVPPSRPPYKYIPKPSLSPPSLSSLCLCRLLEKPLLLENRGGNRAMRCKKRVFLFLLRPTTKTV